MLNERMSCVNCGDEREREKKGGNIFIKNRLSKILHAMLCYNETTLTTPGILMQRMPVESIDDHDYTTPSTTYVISQEYESPSQSLDRPGEDSPNPPFHSH